MARAWSERGLGPAVVLEEPGTNHFSLPLRLCDTGSNLSRALWRIMGVAPEDDEEEQVQQQGEVNTDMRKLQQMFQDMMGKLSKVDENVVGLQNSVASMRSDMTSVQQEVEQLSSELTALKQDIVTKSMFESLVVRVQKSEQKSGDDRMTFVKRNFAKLDPSQKALRIAGFIFLST